MAARTNITRLAEFVAIGVLVLAGVRAGRTWSRYATGTAALRNTLVGGLAKPGIALETLGGIGLDGEPVAPALGDRSRVVLFLLHSRSAAADLEF